jgi:hypothetical protein
MQASKDFSWEELQCPCCQLKYISIPALNTLQNLRDWLRKPLKINSAIRCAKHNAKVGGKPNSRHLAVLEEARACDAFDVSTRGWTPEEINAFVIKAQELGFKGIGRAKSFVHIDMRPYHATWTY